MKDRDCEKGFAKTETIFVKMERNYAKIETNGKTETDFGKNIFKEQMNGHASCPFTGSQLIVENQKQMKPNLRLKVPQPIRLKNHLAGEENFDVLHSQIEEISSFVSIYYAFFYYLILTNTTF